MNDIPSLPQVLFKVLHLFLETTIKFELRKPLLNQNELYTTTMASNEHTKSKTKTIINQLI